MIVMIIVPGIVEALEPPNIRIVFFEISILSDHMTYAMKMPLY